MSCRSLVVKKEYPNMYKALLGQEGWGNQNELSCSKLLFRLTSLEKLRNIQSTLLGALRLLYW
jgi:hypothetical protein